MSSETLILKIQPAVSEKNLFESPEKQPPFSAHKAWGFRCQKQLLQYNYRLTLYFYKFSIDTWLKETESAILENSEFKRSREITTVVAFSQFLSMILPMPETKLISVLYWNFVTRILVIEKLMKEIYPVVLKESDFEYQKNLFYMNFVKIWTVQFSLQDRNPRYKN